MRKAPTPAPENHKRPPAPPPPPAPPARRVVIDDDSLARGKRKASKEEAKMKFETKPVFDKELTLSEAAEVVGYPTDLFANRPDVAEVIKSLKFFRIENSVFCDFQITDQKKSTYESRPQENTPATVARVYRDLFELVVRDALTHLSRRVPLVDLLK